LNIPDQVTKVEIARAISRLNRLMEGRIFIMMGPGRWGSVNIDLGVRVTYADIYNTKALIEIAVASGEGAPALSYGTHFYQDLVETGIHSLPLHLEDPRANFKWSFFEESINRLATLSPEDAELSSYLKVIDLALSGSDRRMTILMDGNKDEAAAFLESGDWMDEDDDLGSISTF
jgi:hypothetical protein